MFSIFPVVALPLLFMGCGGDSTAILQQRAAAVFEKAKNALVREDHRESRRLLREVVALDELSGNIMRRAEASLLLAENYSAGANFDSAFIWYETARSLYYKINDKSGARTAVLASAGTYHLCDNNEKANTLLSEAIRVYRALGDDEGARELQWMLVSVLRARGDSEGERRVLKELSDHYKSSGDVAKQARIHVEIGISSVHRGSYDSALQSFTASVPLADQAKDSVLAIKGLMHSGIVYDRIGKTIDAFNIFTEALQRADRRDGAAQLREEILVRLGNIHIRNRQFAEAHGFLNSALRSAIESQNRLLEAYALLQLGHCMKGMGNAEAERSYRAGADLLSTTDIPWANAYAYMCLGNLALERNQHGSALEYFRNAVSCVDFSFAPRDESDVFIDCENSSPWQSSPYDAFIDMLMQLGKTDEGFLYSEKKNRLATFKALSAMRIKTRRADLNEAFSQFSRQRGNYIGAERQLLHAFTYRVDVRPLAADIQRSFALSRTKMHDLGDSISWTNKQYRAAILLSETSLQEVQQSLPAGSTLVEYVSAKRSLYAFVITPSSSTLQVSAIERSELFSLMREYTTTLRDRNRDVNQQKLPQDRRIRALSSRLYSVFLRPLESRISNGAQLLVVLPSGVPTLPLHALQKAGDRGPHAIEQYSFRYLSDAGVLLLKGSAFKSMSEIVAFGSQGNTAWDVEYELRDIRAHAKESRMYFNRDATIEVLQKEKGDVLQCALEVQYDERRPQNSFFVLSDGAGYVTVRYPRMEEFFASGSYPVVIFSNLSSYDLNPAIPLIFRMNGSAHVIANSYLPLRKTKKYFNELFYTGVIAGKTVDAAYRGVLLEMIKDKEYKAPHLWAPFFLW